ncbi:MAG: hypothetical protein JRJ26_17210 [Deltaproteobacteria bacterium]|nr:hypothetical protein [Deltaproteobacteria bacterium]
MECEICGRPLRRNNKSGYCFIHSKRKNRRSLQTVKRRCLKCDREFLALGTFNRICPSCTEKNREFVDTSRYQTTLRRTSMGLG